MGATSRDILEMDPVLRRVGEAVWAAAVAEATRLGVDWTSVLLDVRYESDGGFVDKLRMGVSDGSVVSLRMPSNITLLLIELEKLRGAGDAQWYGVGLTITSAGEANGQFDYDPNCADDPAFFDS